MRKILDTTDPEALPAVRAAVAYLWESRAAAEHAYGDAWRLRVVERYGAEPRVTHFASPVVVDNSRQSQQLLRFLPLGYAPLPQRVYCFQ